MAIAAPPTIHRLSRKARTTSRAAFDHREGGDHGDGGRGVLTGLGVNATELPSVPRPAYDQPSPLCRWVRATIAPDASVARPHRRRLRGAACGDMALQPQVARRSGIVSVAGQWVGFLGSRHHRWTRRNPGTSSTRFGAKRWCRLSTPPPKQHRCHSPATECRQIAEDRPVPRDLGRSGVRAVSPASDHPP